MNGATWALVEAERQSLADLLEGLTPDQWEAPSLCTEWRVRDVAAHLAMTPAGAPGAWTMVAALARTRGRLWAAGRDVAVAYADRSYAQLVGELRRGAAARVKPVFVSADNILLDLLVHGQDISVPLGLHRAVPTAASRMALDRVWTMGWPFHARRRLAGLSLHADDADWRAGDGAELRGTAADLLLLMTGRTDAALDRLQGPGVELLSSDTAATT